MAEDLFTLRKPLAQILDVPEKVTSVYSMVQHIWEGDDEESHEKSRKNNVARVATVEEYYLDPVRSYLESFLGYVADGEGQGYWMLAHFGVGKSHLMAVEAILAVGGAKAWEIVKRKEDEIKNLGPAARLDRFRAKITAKKIFPVIFTLEGKGGGQQKRLSDFVLEEARRMFELRTGRPLAVTAAHDLAAWYLQEGRSDYEKSLKDFVGNKRLMDPLPKFDGYADWMTALQNPASVEDAAEVLRAFLSHKGMDRRTKTEQGELLENAFRHILANGYDGILIIIDEMSEYMGRTKHANEDEDTLLVLSNTLAKGKKLPIWTVVAAQEAYAKQDKLIGPDRMREEHLEHKPERFRNIVVNRCRQYKTVNGRSAVGETHNYYMGYREKIPWVQKVEEEQFQGCFPFPPQGIEVIQRISRKLTGTRSTISFLHAALQKTLARDANWNEMIALWRVFDELMTYEESKSNSASGTISIKSIFKPEAAALQSAQNKLGLIEIGDLGKKAGKRRAERILNTLFLYHIGGYGGLTAGQILDAVCDLKGDDNLDIQVAYYERILEEMKTGLRGQIRYRDEKYEFTPKETGDFDDLVNQAIEVLKSDPVVYGKYYDKFLEYSGEGAISPFAAYRGTGLVKQEMLWHGQERHGHVGLRDLTVLGHAPTPDTAGSESDFVVMLSTRPVSDKDAKRYLKTDAKDPDPRVVAWIPAALSDDQKSTLIGILAYLKVKDDHRDTKHEKDARSNFQLLCDTGYDLLKLIYQQGKAFTTRKTLAIDWTGGLEGAIDRLAGDALDNCYRAAALDMGRRCFGTDEAVKLINGLVRTGKAVPASDKLYSAVENFAQPLRLVRSTDADKLNASGSPEFKAVKDFADDKGGHAVPLSVFYNKFSGWQPGDGDKSWGLTRRMVDIYLLALAQQGTIRINVRKGQPIDRTTIAGIEFKPETLRSFESVEVPKAWLEWAEVSPYLEVMASVAAETYGPKFDQSVAHDAIAKAREVWVPTAKVQGLLDRVSVLFKDLQQADPYDELLLFWLMFFQDPLGDEDALQTYEACKGSLLKAFEKAAIDELDKEDLAKFREYWKGLLALQEHFDDLSVLVRCGGLYARAEIPDVKEYRALKNAVKKLGPLVARAPEFVIDPDRSRAELLPAMEDVWREYEGPMEHGLGGVNGELDDLRSAVNETGSAKECSVLDVLADGVPGAEKAREDVERVVADGRDMIVDVLPTGDELRKLLRVQDYVRDSRNRDLRLRELRPLAEQVRAAAEACTSAPGAALLDVAGFLDDAVLRAKLKPHEDKKTIGDLLVARNAEEIAKYLLDLKAVALGELTKILKVVLKGLDFITVHMADFKPSQSTLWGEDEVNKTVGEFRDFLTKEAKGKVIKVE
jgi:hypothetical protein